MQPFINDYKAINYYGIQEVVTFAHPNKNELDELVRKSIGEVYFPVGKIAE